MARMNESVPLGKSGEMRLVGGDEQGIDAARRLNVPFTLITLSHYHLPLPTQKQRLDALRREEQHDRCDCAADR